MLSGWTCVRVCRHVAPWIIAAYATVYPTRALRCELHCTWAIPPAEWQPGGMFYRAPTPPRGDRGYLVDLENSPGAYGGLDIAGQLFVTPAILAPPTVNVPEPPTWTLMALALAGLIFVRRMTRK